MLAVVAADPYGPGCPSRREPRLAEAYNGPGKDNYSVTAPDHAAGALCLPQGTSVSPSPGSISDGERQLLVGPLTKDEDPMPLPDMGGFPLASYSRASELSDLTPTVAA